MTFWQHVPDVAALERFAWDKGGRLASSGAVESTLTIGQCVDIIDILLLLSSRSIPVWISGRIQISLHDFGLNVADPSIATPRRNSVEATPRSNQASSCPCRSLEKIGHSGVRS
jgi:hypothetical protein